VSPGLRRIPPGVNDVHPTDPVSGAASLVDPSLPAFIADPHPWYARLRREAPVHFVAAEGLWWVTRYTDVARALGDPRFGKEAPARAIAAPEGPPPTEPDGPAAASPAPAPAKADDPYARLRDLPAHMLDRDPPAHTRMRSLVAGAFTPRVVERLRPRIEEIARDLLQDAPNAHRADLIDEFAFPLPAIVIAELLGVPAADRNRFRRWSADIVRDLGPETSEAGPAANLALLDYFTDLCAERRARPRQDLISELLAAEAHGDRLSAGEVLSTCILLLIAGHETTASLIGTGTLTLLRHPGAWQRLAVEPDLLPAAVEELLRYESPVQRFYRVAQTDIDFAGAHIPRGAGIFLVFAAANRDAEAFPEPDRLALDRSPNPHLAFGRGIHYCLGAPLARLEMAVALSALLRHAPRLRLAGDPEWNPPSVIRSLRSLPVTFE